MCLAFLLGCPSPVGSWLSAGLVQPPGARWVLNLHLEIAEKKCPLLPLQLRCGWVSVENNYFASWACKKSFSAFSPRLSHQVAQVGLRLVAFLLSWLPSTRISSIQGFKPVWLSPAFMFLSSTVVILRPASKWVSWNNSINILVSAGWKGKVRRKAHS